MANGMVGAKRWRWAVLAIGMAQASCAETATTTPGPAPRPKPAGPMRLDLASARVSTVCSSPYPLDTVQPILVVGQDQRPIQQRRDDYGRPLFRVRASFGQLSPDLQYDPPRDLLPLLGKELVLDVAVSVEQENLTGRLIVPPRYDCPQIMNLAGRSGREGWQATPAEDGEPGPQVRVAIGYMTGPKGETLVLVRVDDASGMRGRTLLRSDAPPLQIVIDGGPGGPADPRRSLVKTVVGQGRLPYGGGGGDGGAAEISFDQSFPELERKVVVLNRGGLGGPGVRGYGRPGRPGAIPHAAPAPVEMLFGDEIARGVPIRQGRGDAAGARSSSD